eukprot:2466330-Prymnesium_polylepis.1
MSPPHHGKKLLLINQPGHCKVPPGSVMGLTHQQLNLECGLAIARMTGRIFAPWPLLESQKHTRCAQNGEIS